MRSNKFIDKQDYVVFFCHRHTGQKQDIIPDFHSKGMKILGSVGYEIMGIAFFQAIDALEWKFYLYILSCLS